MKIHLFLKQMLLLCVFAFSASLWGQTAQTLDYTLPDNAKRADLTSIKGWLYSGLGSDYSSSGSNIKFDDTGDNATLFIASAPSTVKYNLKSNGLSGAYNFQVSESADGAIFTVVETITSGIGTNNTVFTTNLSSTTRYIKWTYVNKATGNIGFGGVNVTAPTCTTSTFYFASATVSKTTGDAAFTNTFTTNNTSPKVFASGNSSVATVNSSTGEVTIAGAGSTTISVTQITDGTHCAVSANYTLNVTSSSPLLTISGTLTHGSSCTNTAASKIIYTIINTGQTAATDISVISSNSDFVVSDLSSTTIAASGGNAIYMVTFTPSTVGEKTATITVSSSTTGSNTPSNSLTGTGVNTPPTVTTPTSTAVTATSATLGGNITTGGCSTITERGIYYSTTSGFDDGTGTKVSETGTFSTGVFTISSGSVLTSSTTYYYKAFALSESGVAYSTQGSFTTSCTATTVPYIENFESVTIPNLPLCTSVINSGLGNAWKTSEIPSSGGFIGKVLNYTYNTNNAANTWFFTKGLELTAGVAYQVAYRFGNNNSFYNEKLKVAFGSDATAIAMSNVLADYPTINQEAAQSATHTFTPATTGVYYIGFQAYSAKDQDNLYLDDISVIVAPVAIPTATAATNVASTSFTANWDAVAGADAYELDVYTSTGGPGSTITETFTAIGGATSSTYDTRTWTGDGAIDWTGYKARTDQVVNDGNEAITLRDQSGAYLESGVIPNGLSDISFEVKQVFGGSGGVLTVKVLTGTGFSTSATIGTIAYTTTKSTFNSGAISGITGDYKIVIENNVNARAAIDNLSFTSASTSTKIYVLEAENVGNVTSYPVNLLNPDTDYLYVVRAKDASSTSVNSNVISVTTLPTPTTTWNGAEWSNEAPGGIKNAIIAGDYNEAISIDAKDLTVNSPFTLTVPSTGFVKAENVFNNGTIIVANNGNFVQTGTFTAGVSSTFKVNRTSQDVSRLDYISWSSPLDNSPQTLKEFSPQTLDARFLTYNNGLFVKVGTPNVAFNLGQGYLIRTPNNFIDFPTVQKFSGVFEGTKPNTGPLSYNPSVITGEFVFLGNPYPSAISMQAFYDANAQIDGSFYIWDSVAAKMDTDGKYSGSNYVTHTSMGSVPVGSPFIVPVAQGFFINRGTSNTALLFNDGMRQTTETGTFAKTSVTDKFWLQMTAPSGAKPQMLIGFSQNATSSYDQGLDAKMLDSNADVIYSTVDAKSLIINALGTFSTTAAVNVTANFLAAGNYTISIAQKEGIFTNGQQIYLKDHVTGAETELTTGDYSFAATAGLQADRFTLYFSKGVLASSNVTKGQSIIYADHQVVHVKGASKIASVEVYDMSGKLMKTTKNVNSESTSLTVAYKGIAVVKLALENGEVVTKKIILK